MMLKFASGPSGKCRENKGNIMLESAKREPRKTLVSLLPESAEQRHQRRRRERMIDEVTLMLLQHGMEGWDASIDGEREWGSGARKSAENICHGIIDFDATRNE